MISIISKYFYLGMRGARCKNIPDRDRLCALPVFSPVFACVILAVEDWEDTPKLCVLMLNGAGLELFFADGILRLEVAQAIVK